MTLIGRDLKVQRKRERLCTLRHKITLTCAAGICEVSGL